MSGIKVSNITIVTDNCIKGIERKIAEKGQKKPVETGF